MSMDNEFSEQEKGLEDRGIEEAKESTLVAINKKPSSKKPKPEAKLPTGLWNAPFKRWHCEQWYEIYMKDAGDNELAQWAARGFLDHCNFLVDNMGVLTAEDYDKRGMADEEIETWEIMRSYVKINYQKELLRMVKLWKKQKKDDEEIAKRVTTFTREFIINFKAYLFQRKVQLFSSKVQ